MYYCIVFFSLHTKSLNVQYMNVSIESVNRFALSSFEVGAILLIPLVKIFCFSLLNLYCVFNINLLCFMNSLWSSQKISALTLVF